MKLTIIGGGSVRTPRLIPSLVRRTTALRLEEVWLMDIDGEKLDLIANLCRALADEHGATFRLITTTDARAAIQDADAVITSIRPGREQGRATDERIAMRHGVLGQETTGAAGFAMAMRSLPAILDYARMVEDSAAPGAWIYNFTNPAGLVAQGLTYAGIHRVVGICDSANGAQHAVSRYLQIPMKRVRHGVYGLNHLSWTASVRVDPDADGSGGEEVFPALLGDERFIQSTHMAMFAPGLIEWQKAFLNEYLHYFYHRDEALASLLGKAETRGEETLRLTNELMNRLRAAPNTDAALAAYHAVMGQRGATYMAHARHGQDRVKMEPVGEDEEGYAAVALGCIQAISTGETIYTGLNVPNRGAIPQMFDDDVVEVTCRVNADSITPLPVTGIHDDQLLLMQTVKLYERLAARAILERSRELAYEALVVHPLIGSYPLAKALTDEFLETHRDLVGEWR
ncbi:MAG: 6-phospho-beta-glucosidase [Anaerolineae bacterium]